MKARSISKGFDEPLEEGMVFAVEPKKGIKDVGLVGIENTFAVTPTGRLVTDRETRRGLIPVLYPCGTLIGTGVPGRKIHTYLSRLTLPLTYDRYLDLLPH